MGNLILTVNAGSSSIKVGVFAGDDLKSIKEISKNVNTDGKGDVYTETFQSILEELEEKQNIAVVCHRVVHGGSYSKPITVSDEDLKKLEELTSLAPLHNAPALQILQHCTEELGVPNVAFFDTTFHSSIPEAVKTYMINQDVAAKRGLRKYGFHGISYANILRQVSAHLKKKPEETSLIALHLGSGASGCAIKNGTSVDTTMGLTPLSGLPGSSRSGDVDPSLIFHFTKHADRVVTNDALHMHISEAENILNKDSGWKALAGTSDFSKLLSGDGAGKLAFDIFVDRICNFVGSYYVKLGGKVDALVFAGGVGERSVELREEVIKRVGCLGFTTSKSLNHDATESKFVTEISDDKASSPKTLICPTDEQYEMAWQYVHDVR